MKARKLMSVFMASLVWVSTVAPTYGQILHTQRTDEFITKGVKLISEAILTDIGWQDINVLKVNLGSGTVELRPMESTTLGERKTVLQMTNENGAIAGVNADFFDMTASYAPSFGPVITGGGLAHSYNYKYTTLGPKKYMATFMLDRNNNVLMDYYGVDISVVADGVTLFDISTYNTLTGSLSRPIIVDSSYYKDNTSIVNKYKSEGVYTIIVENSQVTYMSRQDEIVAIPKDGQAIILNAKDAATYYPLLSLDSEIMIQENIVLNNAVVQAVESMKMGIGGGGLIMKGGKAYTGSAHTVSADSRQPRTIIATTNNAQEIVLITIDGRGGTLGANHKELPEILARYGVKDAMYLDGGGSTTLVARDQGQSRVTLQNTPSDGSERKVTNGIGVFSTAPKGTLNKVYIESTRQRTFIGEGITFEVTGVDEYDNPVTIDLSDIKLSVTGITGSFNGLTFYPETEGKGLIIAEVNGVEVATEIVVTSSPVGLYIEPSHIQMNENSQTKVQIYGVDKEGYKIPITSEKVQWTSNSKSITASGSSITSNSKEVTTLTAKYKNAIAEVGVTVGEAVVSIESFEENIGKWAGDTTTVKGKVETSKEIKYHGNQSIKMTYTFDKDTNKQVAYTVFDKPIDIPKDARSINMWVYAKGQNDSMKIQLLDAAGQTHYLKLANSLAYDGWKYQSAWIPENVKLPAQVTRVYVYANENTKKRESAVYFDHMSITRGTRIRAGIQARDDYRYDPLYKDSLVAPKGSDYGISIVGDTKVNSMKLNDQDTTNISSKVAKEASIILLASRANMDTTFGKTTYTYNNQYADVDYKDTKVMFLGTDSGSIRKTNANQWIQMKKSLESTSAKHIIMIASKNPLTQFDDTREGKALHEYLSELRKSTDKNIFVVYSGGTEKEVRFEEGIRYIRVNGLAIPSDNPKDGEYLKFKVHEDNIYYTFESMM